MPLRPLYAFLVVALCLATLDAGAAPELPSPILGFAPGGQGGALSAPDPGITVAAPPEFVRVWGGAGSSQPGLFRSPFGATTTSGGDVYVADRANQRIQQFSADGEFRNRWGSGGTGPGQFQGPTRVAVDSHGMVYVADILNHRIQKFTAAGVFVREWGGTGTGNGQLTYPFGVAVDVDDNVYVTDQFNHRIQVFTTEGVFLRTWGSRGTANGQFDYPKGIAVDPNGNVYVTEIGNHRVQRFARDGTFLARWGSEGTAPGRFGQPHGVAVGPNGHVYVADQWNNRIQEFTPNGAYVLEFGGRGVTNGRFDYPFDVAISADGRVYVADSRNNRIQQFQIPPTNAPPDCGMAVASPSLLWPPTGGMVPITISGITDPDGDPLVISVTGITHDEPGNGRGHGRSACPDGAIEGGAATVRAERTMPGNGRVYLIHFRADDGQGADCSGTVRVGVPANLAPGHDAVDDDQLADALAPCDAGPGGPDEDARDRAIGDVTRLAITGRTEGSWLRFDFYVPQAGEIGVELFDVAGRRVERLAGGAVDGGWHTASWVRGAQAAGVYFVRYRWAGQSTVLRVTLD